MAGKEVKIRVSADTKTAEKEIKGFVAKGRKSLTSLANSFNEIKDAASSLVQGIAAVAGELLDMAGAASRFNQLENAMVGLAAQQGIVGDSFDDLKARMFAAADGMISKADLVKAANSAMLLGVDVQKFDQLINVAKASAEATGQSVSFMLASITEGIGKAQPEILDNLGLSLKMGEVYGKAAAAIGTTADKLTDFQKKTALTNAVLAAGQKTIDALGARTMPTLDQRLQKVNASFADLRLAIGQKMLPATNLMVKSFQDAFDKITSGLRETKSAADDSGDGMAFLGFRIVEITGNILMGFRRFGAGIVMTFNALKVEVNLLAELFSGLGRVIAAVAEKDFAKARRAIDDMKATASAMGGVWIEHKKQIEKMQERLSFTTTTYAEYVKQLREAEKAEKARASAADASARADEAAAQKRGKHKEQVDAVTAGVRAQLKAAQDLALFEQAEEAMRQTRYENQFLNGEALRLQEQQASLELFAAIEAHKGQEEALTLFLAQQEAIREAAAATSEAGKTAALQKRAQIEKKIMAEVKAADLATYRARMQIAQSAAGAIGQIFGNLASMQNQNSRGGLEAYKKLMTLQITASTAAGAIGAFSQASATIPPPAGQIVGGALAATITALGIRGVQQVQAMQFLNPVEQAVQNVQQRLQAGVQSDLEGRIESAATGKPPPAAANGALIRGSRAGSLILAGENNRSEAIIPLENDEAMSKLGGLGGVTVHVTIMGSILSEEIPDRMREAIDTGLRELQISGRSVFAKELASV